MESIAELVSLKRKKRCFKFCPYKITKINPYGNQLRGTDVPKPRSGHRIVVHNGDVYAFGGYNPVVRENIIEHVLFKQLWKFNCASRTWHLLETSGKVPDELASHCVVLYKNQMVVYGGTGIPFGETSSNDTYICNLDTLEWEHLETTGAPPLEQYGQAMTVSDNKMYVIGGTTGFAYTMCVHCLDLETKEWSLLYSWGNSEDDPEPRYRHEVAIYDNKIYVFGGGTAATSYDFKETPVFNLNNNRWSKIQTTHESPPARRCHGCVQIGSDVYICGGLGAGPSGHVGAPIYSDIWKFDLKSFQWTKLPVSLSDPLYFHSAAVSQSGQMFVFGGVNSTTENTRTNDIHSMWLRIPSLGDISWQAALKFIPHVAQLDKRTLYENGVPFSCIEEIDFQTPTSGIATECCYRVTL